MTTSIMYQKCLVWKSEEDCLKVQELSVPHGVTGLVIDGAIMYFSRQTDF